MYSYYENEIKFADLVRRRSLAKVLKVCYNTEEDWVALEGELFPTSPHAIFKCTVCNTVFPWAAGHPPDIRDSKEISEFLRTTMDKPLDIKNIPWWGWGIVVVVVPFAIPICLTGMAINAVRSKLKGSNR